MQCANDENNNYGYNFPVPRLINQINHQPDIFPTCGFEFVERLVGIEPTPFGWKPKVQPLTP